MSGRFKKPGLESSQLHLKPTVGVPPVEAASVGATLAPAQETLAQKIARAIANARDKAISSPLETLFHPLNLLNLLNHSQILPKKVYKIHLNVIESSL